MTNIVQNQISYKDIILNTILILDNVYLEFNNLCKILNLSNSYYYKKLSLSDDLKDAFKKAFIKSSKGYKNKVLIDIRFLDVFLNKISNSHYNNNYEIINSNLSEIIHLITSTYNLKKNDSNFEIILENDSTKSVIFNNKEFICTKRNSDNQIYIYLRHMFKALGLELTHNLNLFYNDHVLLSSLTKIDIKGINVVLFNINSLDILFDKLNEKNSKSDFNLYKKYLLNIIVNNFSVSESVKIPKTYFSTLIDFIKSKERNSILEKENLLLKIEIEELKQKALVHDKSLLAINFQDMKQISSVIGVGRNRLFNILRENKILINGGDSHNLPYQKFIDLGYFAVRRVTISRTSGEEIKNQTLVTPKGILFINKLFNSKSLIRA